MRLMEPNERQNNLPSKVVNTGEHERAGEIQTAFFFFLLMFFFAFCSCCCSFLKWRTKLALISL